MRRKFATYLIAGTLLAASVAGTIRVYGQGGPIPKNNFAPNSNSNYQPAPSYQPTPFNQPTPFYSPVPPSAIPLGSNNPPVNGWGQHPTNYYPIQSGNSRRIYIQDKDGNFEPIEKEQGALHSPENMQKIVKTEQQMQNALSVIRSPDSNEATKKEAKDFVAKYLKAEFKADQDSRRGHVERLEKQVEQLRKQLTNRDESQDRLIELRMQLLENDATGLSFPDAWANLPGPSHVGGFPPTMGYSVGPQFPNLPPFSPIQSLPVQSTPSPNVLGTPTPTPNSIPLRP